MLLLLIFGSGKVVSSSFITSLWSVDDESTSELFLRYYEGRGDKVERLRKAQIETMRGYAHPFYWAGFVMFGEG